MGRITTFVAAFAALSVLTIGAVQAQLGAVGAVVVLCEQVNTLITSVKHGYNAFRAVADATKDGVSAEDFQLPLSEDQQRALDSQRIDSLLAGIADIRTRLAAIEDWQADAPNRERAARQRDLYYESYANSELALSAVREALATAPEQRSENLLARLQTRLDDVSHDALRAEAMGQGWIGEHYVSAVNVSALALIALRTVEPDNVAALDYGKRDRMRRATDALVRAIAFVEAPDSTLNQTLRAETASYRNQLNDLANARTLAPFVNQQTARFLEGTQSACFEVAMWGSRPCQGTECLLPYPDPNRRTPVVTGYQQTRYTFALTRTSVGSDARSMNFMNPLDPRVPQATTTTRRTAPNCPQRGVPDEAWLDAVRTYDEGLRDAAPAAQRAAESIRSLELASATREALTTLRASL